MCAMAASHGLNPARVPVTTLCNLVELGPYLGLVEQLAFDPQYATEAPDNDATDQWWHEEADT